jgi:hypothetical protein
LAGDWTAKLPKNIDAIGLEVDLGKTDIKHIRILQEKTNPSVGCSLKIVPRRSQRGWRENSRSCGWRDIEVYGLFLRIVERHPFSGMGCQ